MLAAERWKRVSGAAELVPAEQLRIADSGLRLPQNSTVVEDCAPVHLVEARAARELFFEQVAHRAAEVHLIGQLDAQVAGPDEPPGR